MKTLVGQAKAHCASVCTVKYRMRKQELIHLHGLFVEIQRHCEREENFSIVLSEYESMDVDTSAIHRQKSEHQRAVLALSEAIVAELGEKRSEKASATAD